MKRTSIFLYCFAAISAGIFTGCKTRPGIVNAEQNGLADKYRWEESDTTLRLINDSTLIWQYNFNNRKGKPYFHPLNLNGTTLTSESPSDHPWHLGLWFSWKYINGLNYWEYLSGFSSEKTGYQSEGLTSIKEIKIRKNKDFSVLMQLHLLYAPDVTGVEPVMEEFREILVSAPLPDGTYYIDYAFRFSALGNDVLLDRTPLIGEPGGQSWGGYAGMSIRFSQQFSGPALILPENTVSGSKNDYMYMGFLSKEAERIGLSIFRDPEYSTNSTSWYVTTNPSIPFFYYSPSALYDQSYLLKVNESLELKYRIWVLAGEPDKTSLDKKYHSYIGE